MANATDVKYPLLIQFLTKVEVEPTYNDIHKYHFKLKANAGSVQSDLGGVCDGLLCLFTFAYLYLILNGSEFNHPHHSV